MLLQRDVLEDLARGMPLKKLMLGLCRRAELLAPGVVCTVLRLDADRRLRTLAAPSLPNAFSRAIDGVEIGPMVGSCGAAAFLGEPVIVADISTDPRWDAFRGLALPLGLHACWSSPILGSRNRVLGAFAFYFRETRAPRLAEQAIVETCTRLCALAIEQDESRKLLRQLAYTDALTGLANRAAFQRRAEEVLPRSRTTPSRGEGPAILCLDLDGFKQVNDDMGHAAGDQLLVMTAQRLRRRIGKGNLVARMGGDEFAILIRKVCGRADLDRIASALIGAFTEPFELDGRKITVSCSIGLARPLAGGCELDAVMKSADTALYWAKSAGRNQYRVFDEAECARRRDELSMEHELRGALARKEIEVHYQPVVDLGSREIVGFEALARWRNPDRGYVPPADFISLAERSGMIVEIGAFVLRESCAAAALWPKRLSLAVNISALQLCSPGFALRVVEMLQATGLAPSRLEFELTETVLLSDDPSTSRVLGDLKALGLAIAIDDFGTGYSALSYLRKFPIDRLKIDKSFVADLLVAPKQRFIVRAVIGLATDFGIKTTAEGIETLAQLEWLRAAGCWCGQGFLLGKPMPAEAVAERLGVASVSRRRAGCAP